MNIYLITLFTNLISEFKKLCFLPGDIVLHNAASFEVVFDNFLNGAAIPGKGYRLTVLQVDKTDIYEIIFYKPDWPGYEPFHIRFDKNSAVDEATIVNLLIKVCELYRLTE